MKISLLQRDPAVKKLLTPLRTVALQYPAPLGFRGNVQKDGQIVITGQFRVKAVAAFHDIQPPRQDGHRLPEGQGAAVEGTVNGGFVPTDRNQNLRFQPLPVQIAAGLGVARGGPLLRTEEEIVGMEQRRIGINRRQQICQSAFAAGGAALNGQQDPRVFRQGPVNGARSGSRRT